MQSLLLEKSEDPGWFGRVLESVFANSKDNEVEEYKRGILPEFREKILPEGDTPLTNSSGGQKTLAASAGLTAVVGSSGKVYTFGLNQRGQCGVGDQKFHHVWEPKPVVLKTGEILEGVTSVDLGLQHGMALDRDGNLYGWGKGARGQLGLAQFKSHDFDNGKESIVDLEFGAIPISDFELLTSEARTVITGNDARVKTMSAGWNHSAAITESNHAFVWGKNALAELTDGVLKPIDSPGPTAVEGLPSGLEIKDISCGSHHTAILMEDGSVYAIGISTDTVEPIGEKAVQIIPPGLIDAPICQFTSHFDRTTILAGEDGQQVLEVQLWSTDELRDSAVFEPEWVETLLQDNARVKMVQRGWLHTVVITEQ